MLLVVDANILFSALIKETGAIELIFSAETDIIAPELLFAELENNKDEIESKSSLSASESSMLLELLKKRIRVISMDKIIPFIPKAIALLGNHPKDAPYVALAIKYGCPLWSYEKKFKKLEDIECLTTRELIERISIEAIKI